MSHTVADQLLERLTQWGVQRVFGYPGDGINGIMGAFGRRAQDFDYIRVRHEEMAAFMAGAHAKFTGEVGVCLATSGPGPSICSMVCTTPAWTTSRYWPSSASRR